MGEDARRIRHIVTLDNHYLEYGQGVMIGAALARTGVRSQLSQIGLKEIPACGSNADVLAYHGLDAAGIARTVDEPRPRFVK
jgi:transketolase